MVTFLMGHTGFLVQLGYADILELETNDAPLRLHYGVCQVKCPYHAPGLGEAGPMYSDRANEQPCQKLPCHDCLILLTILSLQRYLYYLKVILSREIKKSSCQKQGETS